MKSAPRIANSRKQIDFIEDILLFGSSEERNLYNPSTLDIKWSIPNYATTSQLLASLKW